MTDTIRLVVIDDQHLIRAGLVMFLDAEDDLEVVGEAANGRAGLELVRSLRPDVALMDVRMPEMDGIAATERIVLDASLATKVLVLTTFDTDQAVVDAMRAGASGFLLKDADPDEIIRAVRAVAAGDAVVAPSAMRRLLNAMGPGLRGGTVAGAGTAPSGTAPTPTAPTPTAPSGTAPTSTGPTPTTPTPTGPSAATDVARAVGGDVPEAVKSLTPREREVLGLIGAGLTNAEISRRLFLAETTAKTHVHRIMGKLGARDRVQAALIAHRAGLVPDDTAG